MSDSPSPDVRSQMQRVIQGLRMAAFPQVLWRFADALSPSFVPTKTGARQTRSAVQEIRNDAAFRHWICENADPEQVTYCRMALHMMGDAIDSADESQLAVLARSLMARPMLVCLVHDGLLIAESRLNQP